MMKDNIKELKTGGSYVSDTSTLKHHLKTYVIYVIHQNELSYMNYFSFKHIIMKIILFLGSKFFDKSYLQIRISKINFICFDIFEKDKLDV